MLTYCSVDDALEARLKGSRLNHVGGARASMLWLKVYPQYKLFSYTTLHITPILNEFHLIIVLTFLILLLTITLNKLDFL